MLHISTVQFQSVVTQPVDVPESAVPSKPTHPTSGRHVSRLIHRQPLQPSPSGSAALQPSLRALHVLIQGLAKGTLLGLRSWPSSAEVTWNDSAMVRLGEMPGALKCRVLAWLRRGARDEFCMPRKTLGYIVLYLSNAEGHSRWL